MLAGDDWHSSTCNEQSLPTLMPPLMLMLMLALACAHTHTVCVCACIRVYVCVFVDQFPTKEGFDEGDVSR